MNNINFNTNKIDKIDIINFSITSRDLDNIKDFIGNQNNQLIQIISNSNIVDSKNQVKKNIAFKIN